MDFLLYIPLNFMPSILCTGDTFSSASDRLNLVDRCCLCHPMIFRKCFFYMKWCHSVLKDSSNLTPFTLKYFPTMPKYHRVIFMISSSLKLFLTLIFETCCLSPKFFIKCISLVTLPLLLLYCICFPTIDIYVIFLHFEK